MYYMTERIAPDLWRSGEGRVGLTTLAAEAIKGGYAAKGRRPTTLANRLKHRLGSAIEACYASRERGVVGVGGGAPPAEDTVAAGAAGTRSSTYIIGAKMPPPAISNSPDGGVKASPPPAESKVPVQRKAASWSDIKKTIAALPPAPVRQNWPDTGGFTKGGRIAYGPEEDDTLVDYCAFRLRPEDVRNRVHCSKGFLREAVMDNYANPTRSFDGLAVRVRYHLHDMIAARVIGGKGMGTKRKADTDIGASDASASEARKTPRVASPTDATLGPETEGFLVMSRWGKKRHKLGCGCKPCKRQRHELVRTGGQAQAGQATVIRMPPPAMSLAKLSAPVPTVDSLALASELEERSRQHEWVETRPGRQRLDMACDMLIGIITRRALSAASAS